MSVFKKLKDIFYDEVEEEIDVDEPVITKVEKNYKENPVIEREEVKNPEEKEIKRPTFDEQPLKREFNESPKEEVSERELYQNKQTFKFPIFEEEDIKPKEPVKTRSSVTNIMDIERKNREATRSAETRLEPAKPKQFKPSPVISPIYGIMDKDYDKEEIIKEQMERQRPSSYKSTDYDSIRKKAYGSSDREVNNVIKSVDEIEQELDTVKKNSNIEELLQKSKNQNITVGDLEDITEEAPKHEKVIDNVGDKTMEHDLFNLIDSMYDEEDK